MERFRQPIGVFDSGMGGISVLAEALRVLPLEDYLYYGDTLHIPYGGKTPEQVLFLTRRAVDKLIGLGCKAIVLACNTATSAAAAALRQELSLPVIGVEPALKPACLLPGEGKVLVMATQMTLSQPKFQLLMEKYGQDAVSVPCPGLMECVEAGQLSGQPVMDCLESLLGAYRNTAVKAVVLGCTHYVFLKKAISAFMGPQIPLIDGNHGTAQQLLRVLEERGLLETDPSHQGSVQFLTSALERENTLEKMRVMLQLALNA